MYAGVNCLLLLPLLRVLLAAGDLLCVELCNLGPLPGDEWGFTGTFDRENG